MLHATLALVLLAAAVLAAQSPAPAGLDTVLQQAEGQRAAYVATFHFPGFVLWGVTLQPFSAVRTDLRSRFEFSQLGTESRDGREMTSLSYQGGRTDRSRSAVRVTNIYSDFKRFDVSTASDIRLPGTKEP